MDLAGRRYELVDPQKRHVARELEVLLLLMGFYKDQVERSAAARMRD
jgi:hypothetical protein